MTTTTRNSRGVPETSASVSAGLNSIRAGYGLAAVSGLLLALSFPNVDQGWLAWIALAPWVSAFPHQRLRSALGQAAVFGLVFYGGLLSWLAEFAAHAIGPALGVVAWAIATLAQVSVMLLFGAGAHLLARRHGNWAWFLGIPALWTLLEWVRQLGELGTGWGDLAYSQYRTFAILQVTKLAGVWGLSFLIALTGTALAGLRQGKTLGVKIAVPLLIGAFIYGEVTLHTERLHPVFGAAALQANIDPNVSWSGWRAGDAAYDRRVMETYTRQTDDAAKAGAKLVVWPETAFPGYLRDDAELGGQVTRTAQRDNLAIVVGSNERNVTTTPDADANSLILVTPDGRIGASYAKRQLVPFGEFVPGRKWLGFLEALHLTIYDRAAGKPVQPLLDAGAPVGKIGAAICYESSYSRLTQEQVKRGANILIVASDDTWFGRTAAASQHAAISSVRAAESDRYLVRAAPTGISRVIDPAGRVLDEGRLFREKVVLAKVEPRSTMPPFDRYGDWFIVVAGGIVLGAFIASGRGRREGSARSSAL